MKYKNNFLYKLEKYSENGMEPFHMPGHKRNADNVPHIDPYLMDITEIEGFDDLNHPEGIIKSAMERASRIFGSRKTYFLVGGCTAGILASLTALCHNGKKLILAANSHKSAYNAAFLNNAEIIYVYPDANEEVHAESIEKALEENSGVSCVFITSPTYTGVVCDVKRIAQTVHAHGAVLVVDEAHGSHMMFNDIFPNGAMSQGADIVVHGIHKTLPSLTQTALLHIGSDRINIEDIEEYLGVFQSSSPSYILMGSIDYCMDYLETDGEKDFKIYADNLKELYASLRGLKNLTIMPYGKNRDGSKIVIGTGAAAINGKDLYDYFREKCGLQPEMSVPEYVIMMTSVWDKKEKLDKLKNEIIKADTDIIKFKEERNRYEKQDLKRYIGRKAEKMVYLYPPGVPVVLPGQLFDKETITLLEDYIQKGYKIKGFVYGGSQ